MPTWKLWLVEHYPIVGCLVINKYYDNWRLLYKLEDPGMDTFLTRMETLAKANVKGG